MQRTFDTLEQLALMSSHDLELMLSDDDFPDDADSGEGLS